MKILLIINYNDIRLFLNWVLFFILSFLGIFIRIVEQYSLQFICSWNIIFWQAIVAKTMSETSHSWLRKRRAFSRFQSRFFSVSRLS